MQAHFGGLPAVSQVIFAGWMEQGAPGVKELSSLSWYAG
jgi:hypothetical protein